MNLEDHFKNIGKPLLRFLLKRSPSPEVAYEVFSDTYLALTRSWKTFRSKSSFFTWACQIAIHKLADYYRKSISKHTIIVGPLSQKLENIVSPTLSPEEQIVAIELVESIKKCFKLLPKSYTKLLKMRYYEDLSYKEISLRLGVSERKVEGIIYRAKHKFKKAYLTISNRKP